MLSLERGGRSVFSSGRSGRAYSKPEMVGEWYWGCDVGG